MDPRLFLAVIAGGMSGTLVFQIFNVGLSALLARFIGCDFSQCTTEARLAVLVEFLLAFCALLQ